ncbi:unnamed protein product [Gordionus sp. m RMFG-2023]
MSSMSSTNNVENIDSPPPANPEDKESVPNPNSPPSSKKPKRIHKYWNKDKIEIVKKMLLLPETQKMSVRNISKLVDMSTASVHKLRRNTFPDIIGDPLKDYDIQKRGSKKKDQSNVQSELLDLLKANNTFTIQEMIENSPADFPKTKTTIRKYIKSIGWSKKRAGKERYDKKYSPKAINFLKAYRSKVLNTPTEKLFFFSETCIDLQNSPVYGWAPLDVTPIVVIPNSKSKCVSFLCTIGLDGLVNYRVVEGAYKMTFLLEYMADLVKILPEDAVIVMDDIPMHMSHHMDHFKSRVEYLPRHSPQLNPIESFFRVIEIKFDAIHPPPATRDDIIVNISSIMNQYDQHSFSDFYSDMLKFLENVPVKM